VRTFDNDPNMGQKGGGRGTKNMEQLEGESGKERETGKKKQQTWWGD